MTLLILPFAIKEMGKDYPNKRGLEIGDKIASLVSLSLTPLHIDEIIDCHLDYTFNSPK